MDWKAALAHLKTLEGATDAVGTIEGEITRLTNANFELVKDVRSNSSKANEASSKLTDLLSIIGAEGEDLKAKVDSANDKIKKLQGDLTQVSKEKDELETKYKSLDAETVGLKRRTVIQEAASKSGASADVLSTLAKDLQLEQISIDSEGVAIASSDGKTKTPLREYAEANWSAFVPALFPSPAGKTPQLPGGSPGGRKPESSPLAQYRAGTYDKTVERLTSKS